MRMRLWFCRLCVFGLAAVLAWLCLPYPESPPLAALRRPEQSLPERAPDFTWASFQRFWNVHCLAGCEISDPQYVDGRYIVQYGYTISLVASLELGIVRSVTANYTDPKGSQGGGQRWLKLVESIIRVGTFRWPGPRIDQVRARFMEISQRPAAYRWHTSSFRRFNNPSTGWEFTLDFLPYMVTDGD